MGDDTGSAYPETIESLRRERDEARSAYDVLMKELTAEREKSSRLNERWQVCADTAHDAFKERDEALKERDAANARFTKRIGDLTAEHLAIIDAEIAKADAARKERDRAVDALVGTLETEWFVALGDIYADTEDGDAPYTVHELAREKDFATAREAVAALLKGAS